MEVPKKLEKINRNYLMAPELLVGRNFRRALVPLPVYQPLRALTLKQLFLLSYIEFSQYKEELAGDSYRKDLEYLQQKKLITQLRSRLTARGKAIVGSSGVYPAIICANEFRKFPRRAIFAKNLLKYKFAGKVITSNDWGLIDFQDIPPEDGLGEKKRSTQPVSITQFEKGSFGAQLKHNFYNSVVLTPLSIEVGKSMILHTVFYDDSGHSYTSMQYRISIRDYCYFINEYGSTNLKFLARRDDRRPNGILVLKDDRKVGMLLLKDGNYYNRYDYNQTYSNYDAYVEAVRSLKI
jgi:hypothetical protein